MSIAPQTYRAPFDAVALRYDETFTSSRIGQAQRAAVWSELTKAFNPGDRILEIGCGTGFDACFLGKHGVRVVASDSSSEMIAVTTRRIDTEGLQKLVQPRVLRAEDIATLLTEQRFDGAFSNFGALNCVEDLAAIRPRSRTTPRTRRDCIALLDGPLLPLGNRLVSRSWQSDKSVSSSEVGWSHGESCRRDIRSSPLPFCEFAGPHI